MNFKFRRYISAMLCSALLGFSFASCDNDNDDPTTNAPELGTPKYEAESAKYLNSDQDADIQSIEFTSAGNYIINTAYISSGWNSAPSKSSRIKSASMLKGIGDMSRADSFNGIITGKYTIDANGAYILDGFGKITITTESGSYKLNITTTDGETIDINATKGAEIGNSAMTQAICRSWNIDSYRIFIQVGKKTIFDKTAPKNDVKKLLSDLAKTLMQYDDETEWGPEEEAELNLLADVLKSANQIVFSKSGTYMVTYTDDLLAISTWAWANESKGLIRYSWDYTDIDNDGMGGFATVSFDGNKLNVTESMLDEDDDDEDDEDYYSAKFELTYITSEAK